MKKRKHKLTQEMRKAQRDQTKLNNILQNDYKGFGYKLQRIERWKKTKEAQYLLKHCSREYYETLQEMERPSYYYRP